MKKKILSWMLAIACAVGSCTVTTAQMQPVCVEAAKKKAPSINRVYSAVKKAYGDNYRPDVKLTAKEIKDVYGISSRWYSSAIAERPMISVHADELVIVKAKNAGAKKKIKKALVSYRKTLQEESRQYPMNLAKVQAARIYVKGDYVCLFILGSIDDKLADSDNDAKKLEAFQAQNEKAVKAIKKLY